MYNIIDVGIIGNYMLKVYLLLKFIWIMKCHIKNIVLLQLDL